MVTTGSLLTRGCRIGISRSPDDPRSFDCRVEKGHIGKLTYDRDAIFQSMGNIGYLNSVDGIYAIRILPSDPRSGRWAVEKEGERFVSLDIFKQHPTFTTRSKRTYRLEHGSRTTTKMDYVVTGSGGAIFKIDEPALSTGGMRIRFEKDVRPDTEMFLAAILSVFYVYIYPMEYDKATS